MNDAKGETLTSDVLQLQARGDTLQLTEGDSGFYLSGPIHIVLPENSIEGKFNVRIAIPLDFPKGVPRVWETSGALDTSFRHFLEDGSLCLGVHADLLLRLHKKPTLVDFFEEIVVPYFVNYAIWKHSGAVVSGERSHGANGVREFFLEFLNCGDTAVIFFLRCLSQGYRNTHRCPCASGRTIGECHGDRLAQLRGVRPPQYYSKILASLTAKLNTGARRAVRRRA